MPGVRLSVEERWEIRRGLVRGDSLRSIAVVVGRPVSTVAREVARNGGRERYRAQTAQRRSKVVGARPKLSRFQADPELGAVVDALLAKRWSPEQIRNWLRREHPGDDRWVVSVETIYKSLYVQARGGLKTELKAALRSGRTKRKPTLEKDGRGRLKDMVPISERPAEAEDRAMPGHWEGDLILGSDRRSALVTLVERTTRYVLLAVLAEEHTAPTTRDVLAELIKGLPDHLRRSLTWDQGKEMAAHVELSVAADVKVFFCDPGKPWQRGTNENTNRLLRQYWPKGTSFTTVTDAQAAEVAAEINGRPRKTLGWNTPAEAYARYLQDVATTP